MKKISEFATLCGTSPKTLRFYEKVGLLKASYTNPENGYRYYDDEQEKEYELITAFKEIGFTLEEIKNEVLNADALQILTTLRKKEAELQKAQKICAEQIALYNKKISLGIAPQNDEVTVRRYNEENKIVISDGNLIRTFISPPGGMDICTETLTNLFCLRGINISLSDIPDMDEDRPVLVYAVDATMEEILSGSEAVFDKSIIRPDLSIALISIQIDTSGEMEHVYTITENLSKYFPQKCGILWAMSFDPQCNGQAKVRMIGIC